MNTTSVDSYLQDGCGRCDHYQTPACKVHLWTDALVALRELLRQTELVEEMKWGSPCYTLDGKNVVMMTSFRGHCSLSFFKGVALSDDEGVLVSPGPSSRFMRYLRFTSGAEVVQRRAQIERFLRDAIALERSGVSLEVPDAAEPMPAELEERLTADDDLRRAYDALTPGRQRSHILHVSGGKQSATRARRVEACATKILAGKGFNER